MSSINRSRLTFRSPKCASVISFVRICHLGVVEKAALVIALPLHVGYRLMAIRSAGILTTDKAIADECQEGGKAIYPTRTLVSQSMLGV